MNRYYLALAELSRSVMSDSLPPHELYSLLGSSVHGDSPGKNTEMGCHALLQGIFPTQGSKLCLLHCRWILCPWAIILLLLYLYMGVTWNCIFINILLKHHSVGCYNIEFRNQLCIFCCIPFKYLPRAYSFLTLSESASLLEVRLILPVAFLGKIPSSQFQLDSICQALEWPLPPSPCPRGHDFCWELRPLCPCHLWPAHTSPECLCFPNSRRHGKLAAGLSWSSSVVEMNACWGWWRMYHTLTMVP